MRGAGVLVIPAIDVRGGRCVRLRQGDYHRETVYGDDPAAVARRWIEQGARALHVVDLDGAREGRPVNVEAIRAIQGVTAEDAEKTQRKTIQLGGGLRTEADLKAVFELGVDRAVIGTQALKRPEWFAELARRFPGRMLLGLDARDGRVATHGWLEVSDKPALELAQQFDELPLAGIIYTDISRDGMMEGPNFRAIEELANAVKQPVIASGGVTTIEDVRRLAELPVEACIVGRALYEGTMDLAEAIGVAGQ